MRIVLLATAAILATGYALAAPPVRHRVVAARPHGTVAQRPVDVGPFTPAANRAYQGGGVVLQGAPGAPAPTPQPTPPGRAPANSVQP